MRTFIYSFIALIICILGVNSLSAQVIQINQTFSRDTVITPFSGSVPVYSLSFSGGVNLLSDSSLVRVVLIDTYGNHYMVFEAYPLITLSNTFDTLGAADETAFLNGVICDSLRIDIINAFLDADSLKLDTAYIPNAPQLQAQAKWDHDSVKIDIMNRRIVEEQMYWRAGRTSKGSISFQEKETLFGKKYNILGFDYYRGGIFEKAYRRPQTPASTAIVSNFDWRNRHGANDENSPYYDGDTHEQEYRSGWLTEVRPQGLVCGSCYAFAALGATEAYLNLYYNAYQSEEMQQHYDIDLSEQHIVSCCTHTNGCSGGDYVNVYYWMKTDKVKIVEESCFEYEQLYSNVEAGCEPCTTSGVRKVGISGYMQVNDNDEDELKENLILYGPMASGFDFSSSSHAMVLIGYGISLAPSLVYQGTGPDDPDIYIEEGSPIDGNVNWIFKNSFGYGNPNGEYDPFYITVACPSGDLGTPERITGDLNLENIDLQIKCNDEDGDGYYWWGTSQITPCSTCPPGISQFEDCDDHNPNVGPYNTDSGNEYPLYECLPNCTYDPHPLYITENTSWNEPMHFNRNISIIHGQTLTINSQITFGPAVKIFVNPGATLIINAPAVLTTSDYCNSHQGYLWDGIYVLGDPLKSQEDMAYQGKVKINGSSANMALIENARFAINMLNPEFTPAASVPPYQAPSGGVIQAEYARFQDCQIAVRFYPYRFDHISYFRNCSFTTENDLANGEYPDCFIRMDGVSGVEIKKCIFQNTLPQNENPFGNRGKGLYCFNSSITLPESGDPNLFSSLDYGIYAMNGAAAPIINVKNCHFQDNQHGCYFNGFQIIGNVIVEENQFYHIGANRPWGTSYMLYLHDCSGYQVRNNSFEVDDNVYILDDNYIGIIVHNSGPENNWIYRNTFTNLTVSIQSQNQNREDATPALTGLRLLCNTYSNVKTIENSDVKVTYDQGTTNWINGIASDQINLDPNFIYQTQIPAGNTFTFNYGTNHYDINMDPNPSVNEITYYHHNDNPNYRLIPSLFPDPNEAKVTNILLTYNYDPSQSCPDNYFPQNEADSLRSQMDQSQNKIDSLQTLLSIYIDDGSTDSLNTEVLTSTTLQSYDIYHDLMNISPYVSDTVMETSIMKEDVLPNVMIRDIMVANPHSGKRDKLLTALDNRLNPMADSLWFDIIDAADSLSGKEILENQLSTWIQKKDICFNRLVELYRNDTIHSWAKDSLVAFLNTESSLKAKYNLIYWYIENEDFISASNVLQAIPASFDLTSTESLKHQKTTTLLQLLDQLTNDSLGFICPDSVQSAALLQLIANVDDLPGNFARNILLAGNLISYEEPVVIGTTLKHSKWPNRVRKTQTNESFVKIYPNPCRDYFIVEYLNEDYNLSGFLELKDLSGRTILTSQFLPGYDQTIIPLLGLRPCIYFLYYQNSNGIKNVYKIVKSN